MSKRQKNTLDAFLKKFKTDCNESEPKSISREDEIPMFSGSMDKEKESRYAQSATNTDVSENVGIAEQLAVDCSQPQPALLDGKIDVGFYIEKQSTSSITDLEKFNILKCAWTPDNKFIFPFSVHMKNKKEVKCYLSQKHFNCFNWLTYSCKNKGLFCKYCFLFSNKYGGINKATPLKKLVTVPLDKYSKLLGKDGDLTAHEQNKYHKESVAFALDFMKIYERPQDGVLVKLDSARQLQIKENRERLIPIIESIIFLGRQNLALRGHRDYGEISVSSVDEQISGDSNNSQSILNEGNFRELLRYRVASGDEKLKTFLENTSSRATYISNTTQNELIKCCGEEILNTVLTKIKENKYYGVIFDETTDISRGSQMSIIVRYLEENHHVSEDFVAFIDVHDDNFEDFKEEPVVSGKVLATTVLSFLENTGLDLNDCVAIATDTCSVMLSDQKGAVVELQKSLKNAIKCPCYSHALNLSLSKSSSVQDIRNAIGTMKEIINFFNVSPKRNKVLKQILIDGNSGHEQLKKLCETRWTERHEAVLRFKTYFVEIVSALELVTKWKDTQSSSSAQTLLNTMLTTNFIVAVYCLSFTLNFTESASKLLQKKNLDAKLAKDLIKNIISVLKEKRENAKQTFSDTFIEISKLHEKLDLSVSLPRRVKNQTNRSNVMTDSAEDYFRITVYIPLLENVIEDLDFRFPSKIFDCLASNSLVPSEIVKKSRTEISASMESISKYLAPIITEKEEFIASKLRSEIELWVESWNKSENDLPNDAISAFSHCNKDMYPYINMSLKLLCTLPVTTASSERSFSALKRLKTWLRTTMTQERLTGLALLHVHRQIPISVDNVINRFANMKNRRLEFVI